MIHSPRNVRQSGLWSVRSPLASGLQHRADGAVRILWFLPNISAFKRPLNALLCPLDDQLAPINPDGKEISLFEWKARIIGQLCR